LSLRRDLVPERTFEVAGVRFVPLPTAIVAEAVTTGTTNEVAAERSLYGAFAAGTHLRVLFDPQLIAELVLRQAEPLFRLLATTRLVGFVAALEAESRAAPTHYVLCSARDVLKTVLTVNTRAKSHRLRGGNV